MDNTINEESKKFSNSLGIQRFKMPQIESKDVEDFINWIENKHNIKSSKLKIEVSLLKPTQDNYNPDKVDQLKDAPMEVLQRVVIASNDNYILDGHHRYLALLELNKSEKMNIIKVDTDIKELLLIADLYPKSFTKGINEGIMSFKEFIM